MSDASGTSPRRATTAPVAAPYAVPRVAPQRRWRPALVWLAVALVATGGLIAVAVLRKVGTTAEYLAVGRRVEVGTAVTRADLNTVRITVDPALKPVRAGAVGTVIGRFAAVPLVPGTLLTGEQLTDTAVPGTGRQLVGISLPEDRMPSHRVRPGAKVLLVVTAGQNAAEDQQQATAPPLSIAATVVDVRAGAKSGTTVVNVAVPDRDGSLVAAHAAAGRIVIALTAGG